MEPKPKRVRKPRRSADNARWPDRTRTARIAKRVAALNAIAQAAGFDTWRLLETAVLNGKARIVKIE
jgi:hypothetical protein